ncbi:unnamed protein product [Ectocarpus sp. 8 AP-2014]
MPVTRRATSKLVQARQRSSDDDDPTKGGVALGGVQASPDSEVSRRLDLLMDKSFGDLQFLSDEFSKLEVVVAPAVQERDDSGKAGTDSKLGRLRFFTTHVRRTMARMRDARSGRDPLSMSQLALLEEHIATSITPGGGGGYPVRGARRCRAAWAVEPARRSSSEPGGRRRRSGRWAWSCTTRRSAAAGAFLWASCRPPRRRSPTEERTEVCTTPTPALRA